MNTSYVRVFNFAGENISDSEAVEKAISYAKENKIQTILLDTRDWIIDRAIPFYSDSEFIVDGVTSFAKRCNIGYMVGSGYASGQYGNSDEENFYLSKINIKNVETNNCLSAVVFKSRVEGLVVSNVNQKTPGGAVVSILDTDDAVINNCTAVSGIIKNSADNWENPTVNPFFN